MKFIIFILALFGFNNVATTTPTMSTPTVATSSVVSTTTVGKITVLKSTSTVRSVDEVEEFSITQNDIELLKSILTKKEDVKQEPIGSVVTEQVIVPVAQTITQETLVKQQSKKAIILRNQYAGDGFKELGKFRNLYIDRNENGGYLRTSIIFIVLNDAGLPIDGKVTVNNGECLVQNQSTARVYDDNNNKFTDQSFVQVVSADCGWEKAGTYHLNITAENGAVLDQDVEVIESPYNKK